ncbi:hypothetical protein [Brevibacillus brevis]|uniref:Replication protein n=1 Tax=Brevibacillus brevis TaxID=1393 RepID=A0A517I0S6_BREBE|nr:hypothetical protein [Brevibacillus brevis]QDS32492.1 hypothetical protein FPS98_00015 [Brevibacillus brevis]
MGIAEYGTTGFYVLPRLTFRCKRDKWIFQEIMSEANFKDNEKCKRGQVVFIMKDYAKETNWSEDQIKYSLKQLKTMGLIQWQLYRGNTKNGLLITVNHYDEFQNLGSYSRQKGSNFPEENPEEFPPEFPKREDAENPNVSRDEGASDGQDSRRASEDNPEEIPEVYKNSIKEQHVKHKKDSCPKRTKRVYDESTDAYILAKYLRGRILRWKPNANVPEEKPNALAAWADDMRKMITLDKRSKYDIQLVIQWATDDPFWQTNILSAGTLRKQYDQLEGQMRRKVVPMYSQRSEQTQSSAPAQQVQDKVHAGFEKRAANDLAFQEMLFGKGDST